MIFPEIVGTSNGPKDSHTRILAQVESFDRDNRGKFLFCFSSPRTSVDIKHLVKQTL